MVIDGVVVVVDGLLVVVSDGVVVVCTVLVAVVVDVVSDCVVIGDESCSRGVTGLDSELVRLQ